MNAAQNLLTVRRALIRTRTMACMSQQDIGDRLGVTRQTVSAWELGVNFPPSDKLFSWASALGLRLSVLDVATDNCETKEPT